MDDTLLRRDYGDGIAGIVLNRAPVNALSVPFLGRFAGMLDDMAADESVRGVVISSSFRVFSAGIDLKEAMEFTVDEQTAMADALNTTFLRQFAFPKPVVAAVNGAAIAGGMFFVLTSDFRVAGPDASFGLAEIRVGVDFPVGPLEFARATLSPDMLRRLMLTGRPIGTDEARTAGIIDVAETGGDTVVERAVAAARDMAASPPDTYARVKQQITRPTVERIEAALAAEAENRARGWFTEHTQDAMMRVLGGF